MSRPPRVPCLGSVSTAVVRILREKKEQAKLTDTVPQTAGGKEIGSLCVRGEGLLHEQNVFVDSC